MLNIRLAIKIPSGWNGIEPGPLVRWIDDQMPLTSRALAQREIWYFEVHEARVGEQQIKRCLTEMQIPFVWSVHEDSSLGYKLYHTGREDIYSATAWHHEVILGAGEARHIARQTHPWAISVSHFFGMLDDPLPATSITHLPIFHPDIPEEFRP